MPSAEATLDLAGPDPPELKQQEHHDGGQDDRTHGAQHGRQDPWDRPSTDTGDPTRHDFAPAPDQPERKYRRKKLNELQPQHVQDTVCRTAVQLRVREPGGKPREHRESPRDRWQRKKKGCLASDRGPRLHRSLHEAQRTTRGRHVPESTDVISRSGEPRAGSHVFREQHRGGSGKGCVAAHSDVIDDIADDRGDVVARPRFVRHAHDPLCRRLHGRRRS